MRFFILEVVTGGVVSFVKGDEQDGDGFTYTTDISGAKRYNATTHAHVDLGKRVLAVGGSWTENWSIVEVQLVTPVAIWERVPEGVQDTLSRVSEELKQRVRE